MKAIAKPAPQGRQLRPDRNIEFATIVEYTGLADGCSVVVAIDEDRARQLRRLRADEPVRIRRLTGRKNIEYAQNNACTPIELFLMFGWRACIT